METKLKQALEKVISAIQNDRELYNNGPRCRSRDKNNFTVMGLMDISCNHTLDRCRDLFKIEQMEAFIIRDYWHNENLISIVSEIYKEFPNSFDGEAASTIQLYSLKNIPQFK